MIKSMLRFLLSGIFLVVTIVLILLAKYADSLIFSFYPELSRGVLSAIASFTGLFPAALWELLVVLLLFSFFYTLLRAFSQLRVIRWLSGLTMYVSLFVLLFVALWGLNYFAPPISERLELQTQQYSVQQLKEATAYYRDMANRTAPSVQRNTDGSMKDYDFYELAEHANEGYEILAETMPCFNGSSAPVKRLLASPVFAATGTTGIFIPFTAESSVSYETYTAAMPFTMCHELAHRLTFAREDEANFAGFLACSVNERPEFQYSGYYMAFRYCYNALYDADSSAAGEIWAGVGAQLAADCDSSAKHYEAVRSDTLSDLTDVVYDSYLKSFDVESGVQSYGEVADLLIAWYFEEVT